MDRITIMLAPDTIKKLQENSENKKISLSSYVRDLIDIGLRVEKAASQNDEKSKKSEIDNLGELKELWKNGLTWQLESRYLLRHIIDQIPYGDRQKNMEMLKAAKDKATGFVEGLLHEEA